MTKKECNKLCQPLINEMLNSLPDAPPADLLRYELNVATGETIAIYDQTGMPEYFAAVDEIFAKYMPRINAIRDEYKQSQKAKRKAKKAKR